MLPMGTIVTACMFTGLLFTSQLPLLNAIQRVPIWLKKAVGFVVFAAGAWNVFWYALRNIPEFWGFAALLSGALMILLGISLLKPAWIPSQLSFIMPFFKLLLFLIACYYAWTIYHL